MISRQRSNQVNPHSKTLFPKVYICIMSLQSRQVYIRSLRHNPKSPPFLSDFGSHKTNSTSSICNSEREIVGKSSLTQEWSSLPNVLTRPALIWSSVLADLAVTLCTMPFFALASSLALAEGDVVERSQWSTFQDHTKVVSTFRPCGLFFILVSQLLTIPKGCHNISDCFCSDNRSPSYKSCFMEAGTGLHSWNSGAIDEKQNRTEYFEHTI